MKLKFSEKLVVGALTTIVLLQTTEASGSRWYYYVAVKGDKLATLQAAIKTSDDIMIEQYGTILARGYGTPTEQVKATMKEKYGCVEEYAIAL